MKFYRSQSCIVCLKSFRLAAEFAGKGEIPSNVCKGIPGHVMF